MNRIELLFKNKKTNVLSVYFTAGFPKGEDTLPVLKALQIAGVDLVEIGIPFSDPLADGPVIQQSNKKALENGMSVERLFDQLKNVRKEINIPLILMGYLNPVYKYGINKFVKQCKSTGIDGVIIPDLPIKEYQAGYKEIFEANNLAAIFLITPVTPVHRIRLIDSISHGFIYMVSSASTTGIKSGISKEQKEYFRRISSLDLKNPVLIGFGISDHNGFATACEFASGAIVGSAFIKALEKSRDVPEDTKRFVGDMFTGRHH